MAMERTLRPAPPSISVLNTAMLLMVGVQTRGTRPTIRIVGGMVLFVEGDDMVRPLEGPYALRLGKGGIDPTGELLEVAVIPQGLLSHPEFWSSKIFFVKTKTWNWFWIF